VKFLNISDRSPRATLGHNFAWRRLQGGGGARAVAHRAVAAVDCSIN